jgi:hypothetical protein
MLNVFTIFSAAHCKNGFFGLKPWFEYLKLNHDCEIVGFNILPGGGEPSDIPLILLAVVDDLLRIAGIIAVGFVIYGAFQYVASQGSPEATARAQGTVINALLGLAVAIAAVATVSFIGSRLN